MSAIYISAGQSPFANAAPTVKGTTSALAELAAKHSGTPQQVSFSLSDVLVDPDRKSASVRVSVGDEVSFCLCAEPQSQQLVARRICQTKAAEETPREKQRQVDPAKMTRFAKGPDGTRGFAAGRGRGKVV